MSEKPRFVYKDAGTGRFVSRVYAEQHPDTTVRQVVNRTPEFDRHVAAVKDDIDYVRSVPGPRSYRVGENGPETFIPDRDGRIIAATDDTP